MKNATKHQLGTFSLTKYLPSLSERPLICIFNLIGGATNHKGSFQGADDHRRDPPAFKSSQRRMEIKAE